MEISNGDKVRYYGEVYYFVGWWKQDYATLAESVDGKPVKYVFKDLIHLAMKRDDNGTYHPVLN